MVSSILRHSIKMSSHLFRVRTLTTLPANLKICFIGLGNMGLPMCMNLLNHFPTVLACDLNPKSLSSAEKAGAQPLSCPKALSNQNVDVVFTSLPGCDAVTSVYDDILSVTSQNNNLILVDCSTISPLTAKVLHEKVQASGKEMLDAPVSGGVRGAKEATLTFMVGGNTSTLQTVQPLLETMGKNVIHCGGPSSGSTVKLCNNMALASQMIGIAEAMNLGDTLGVDPNVLAKVINMSTAGCWSSRVNNPHPHVGDVAKNQYEGGFGTNLMLKDLGLALQAAESMKVPVPVGGFSKELYRLAEKRGLGKKDFGVVFQFLKGD